MFFLAEKDSFGIRFMSQLLKEVGTCDMVVKEFQPSLALVGGDFAEELRQKCTELIQKMPKWKNCEDHTRPRFAN